MKEIAFWYFLFLATAAIFGLVPALFVFMPVFFKLQDKRRRIFEKGCER